MKPCRPVSSRSGRRCGKGAHLGRALRRTIPVALWLVAAAVVALPGLDYYRTPVASRPFTEAHAMLKPTGPVGHGFGVVGTGMIVLGVAAYVARKRVAALSRLGKLRHWLTAHIFLCTFGPFLVLLHTSFKFGGLVAISFWSMAAVVGSGIFGRYVYVRVPKTVHGRFLSIQTLEQEKDRLLARMSEETRTWVASLVASVAPARAVPRGLLASLWLAARFDFTRRAHLRRAERLLTARRVAPVARRSLMSVLRRRFEIEQQIALLTPFQRLFRYWHLFHLPLTIVMFLILAVHVTVAILFGYTWVLK